MARLEQIPEGERLNPEQVVEDIRKAGVEAHYEDGTDAVLECTAGLARPGDVVIIFSNGGFDGLHGRLLERLGASVLSPG